MNLGRGFFVTGTDTEIGKTVVSAGLIERLKQSGVRVAGMKPVASGCVQTKNGLRNDDAMSLMGVANVDAPYSLVNPYAFEEPVAPHIAAGDTPIELGVIDDCFQKLQALSDQLVVEGVGGWQVPLNNHQTVADLAVKLGLPVILVVGMRLGCLNHALLTCESIERSGLKVAGWVANYLAEDIPRVEENVETLERLIDYPLLGVVPFMREASAGRVADYLNLTPF